MLTLSEQWNQAFKAPYRWASFLDKFTFSCVRSTSFPWQILLLVCKECYRILFAKIIEFLSVDLSNFPWVQPLACLLWNEARWQGKIVNLLPCTRENKALGKLGNIVVETFVILDVSSNVSLFAHPWKHCCGNKICFPRMFPSEFRNILCFPMFLTNVS
jgi:hypothetical protein